MAGVWGVVRASARALGLTPDPRFEQDARRYLAELDRWNRIRRLTGYRSDAERVEHLILESLLLLTVLPEPASPLLDIGTGAGVPGLVLKLARPAFQVTLVEARRWPVSFVRHVVRELGLEGVRVLQDRAERLASDDTLAGAFRTVTMRAVAPTREATALAAPFLAPDGHLVLPVGPRGPRTAGRVVSATVARPGATLPLRRAFLIITAADVRAERPGVPRETPRPAGSRPDAGSAPPPGSST